MPYVSHADVGGHSGFGPVVPEPEGDMFHASWEPRVHALTIALGVTGNWNIDMSRSARETLPDYLTLTYYEIWLNGLEKLLIERGLVTRDELSAGCSRCPPAPVGRVLKASQVAAVLVKWAPTERAPAGPARFRLGQRVRTCARPAEHHTRLPGYVRGKTGIIERVLGAHVFADSHAQALGEDPQWLYTVAFDATELWGSEATPGHRVSFDAWQPYLEAA
jgi:nitrile hydratase subunit beta